MTAKQNSPNTYISCGLTGRPLQQWCAVCNLMLSCQQTKRRLWCGSISVSIGKRQAPKWQSVGINKHFPRFQATNKHRYYSKHQSLIHPPTYYNALPCKNITFCTSWTNRQAHEGTMKQRQSRPIDARRSRQPPVAGSSANAVRRMLGQTGDGMRITYPCSRTHTTVCCGRSPVGTSFMSVAFEARC